jgi:hypothetical protein
VTDIPVLREDSGVETWQRKFDWIAEQGGMGLLITDPDFMVRCWHALPRDVVRAQRS